MSALGIIRSKVLPSSKAVTASEKTYLTEAIDAIIRDLMARPARGCR